ncbi:GspH/FimT family pseudopilin [Desulfoluna spongiiphila]|uniref:Type II secretion system protein H n=1 Tax=Desulfoluna spongiiphila TaxID=419481 RepID=A0A1G5J031_9BACT|nr:GspH/FimT family pseudopilin [Desulfoluna spongiiphila]SCY81662.1 prepilin-type N-terminal cleavage/methylation domain-containing protein [Desulfoluna spongiiphila]VVS91774.1 general secretion pathway gsph [Desulfoluna spongiiphila]
MNNDKGFTLLELMVAVGLITILVGIAAPEFKQWTASQRLSASVRSIHSAFQLARLEAIKGGGNVVVAFSEGTGSGGTYSAFVDEDGDRDRDTGEKIIASGSLSNQVTIGSARFDLGGTGTKDKLKTHFDSRGLTTGRNGEVRLTNVYGKAVRVVLNSAGSSRVDMM